MVSYQSRLFEHNGKTYEVRFASDGHTYHVRAFLDGKPANGYAYSVEMLTQFDAESTSALINPLQELISTAERDVRNGTWEKYVEAVKGSVPSKTHIP